MTVDNCGREAERSAKLADLVFIKLAERFDEFEFHVFGETADVVVRFDADAVLGTLAFDDVGIDGPLDQIGCVGFFGGFFEDVNKCFANNLAFFLWIYDSFETSEEKFLRAHNLEIEALSSKGLADGICFSNTHESRVYVDAHKVLADGA